MSDQRSADALANESRVPFDVMDALVALHQPDDVEVECWADDENGPEEHARRYPECPGNDDPYQCEGHSHDFRTCRECGTVGSHDEVRFRPWPCATLLAVGFDPATFIARGETP